MARPARTLATYEDILEAPDNVVAELIAGALQLSPRPRSAHLAAASALGEELGPPFKRGRGGPGGWIILDEPELHLGGDVLPDLAGWRRERMPRLKGDLVGQTIPPDWIAEVLSPTTEKADRSLKLPIYARENVGWVWLVAPQLRTLEVYRLGPDKRWVMNGVFGDDARVRAEPFDAIELDLSVLWADVDLQSA